MPFYLEVMGLNVHFDIFLSLLETSTCTSSSVLTLTPILFRQLWKTTQKHKLLCTRMQRDKWDLMHNPHQIQQLFAQHVPFEYPVDIKKKINNKNPRKKKKSKLVESRKHMTSNPNLLI